MVGGALVAVIASGCGLSFNRATNSAIGSSSPAPSAAASVGPCPVVPGAAIDRPPGGVERILFARPTGVGYANDLWIYDMKTDKSRRLVRGGKHAVNGADFSGPETISYGLGDYDESRVIEIDLRTGKSRVLLEGDFTPGAWDPTGSALSLTRSQSQEVDVSSVALTAMHYCRATGKVHRLGALGDAALRESAEDEDAEASWSPDGRMLLVQEILYSDDGLTGVTMFVVRPDGSDVAPPGEGTFATWSPDGSRIYYRSTYRDSYKLATPELDSRRVWYSFDPVTGSRQTLAVRHDAMRPSVSPDGTRLAYDTSGKHPAAYVFDLAVGTERKVADDAVDAMWVSNDELVLTKTRPCNVDDCWETPWAAIGPVFRVDLTTGTRKSLSLPWVQRSYFLSTR